MPSSIELLDSITGGRASSAVKTADAVSGGAASRAVATAEDAVGAQAGQLAQDFVDSSLAPKVQKAATQITQEFVSKGLKAIPPRDELAALGREIGQQILDYLNTQVLSKVYYTVASEVRLNGFAIGEQRKKQMYATLISKIPAAQKISALGVNLVIDIRAIAQAAIPYAAFEKLVDDIVFLLSTVADTVKPEAIKAGRRVVSSAVLLGVVLGSAFTYGFVRLYNSTSDAPFGSKKP